MILVRLFYWQVIRFDYLSARADRQHFESSLIEAPRGTIFSSDGSIYVTNKPVYLLYAMPKQIQDKKTFSEKLASLLVFKDGQIIDNEVRQKYLETKNEILDKVSQDLVWVQIEKKISLEQKMAIEKLELTGVGFESFTDRFYPEASSAAHVLGFVGSNELGKQTGYFGVEGFYNNELKGIGGELTQERDALGLPILTGRFFKKDAKNGHNLTLNIDKTVQYIVEKKLKEGMMKYGAKSGSVLVMDPKTGAILAMSSYPNYDPQFFTEYPKEYFKNPNVAESYEPGSTFKVLIMAAAVNEKLVTPETKCDICSGPISIGGFLIRTWNNRYSPNSTMSDVLIHSDNTGMVYIGRKLGLDKTYDYLERFGFGNATQSDLQDEVSPSLRSKDDWGEIDLATSTFGQGIAVTPIQMVRAVSAIANGGDIMEPHIVKSINDGRKIITIDPKIVGTPISKEAAKTVTDMMVQTVEKGEAKFVSVKGYKIAGKTGTAQIPVAGHYDPTKTVASFIGFAPANDPKFIMLVKYNEPSSSIYGAETAAPTFFAIAHDLLIYYNVPPSN